MAEFLFPNPASGAEVQHDKRTNAESNYLCWSRMQSEAGQSLEAIVARKELERRAGDGLFMWGVGNAPSVAIAALSRLGVEIPVVFSIMKSRPKANDLSPSRIVAWRQYFDVTGVERCLPANVIVTSRGDSARGIKRSHYALMCYSEVPLRLVYGTSFDVAAYRNAGGLGAPVGASQVTVLLRRRSKEDSIGDYEVNMKARLTKSYWVRLSDPVDVSVALATRVSNVNEICISDWISLARDFRDQAGLSYQSSQSWPQQRDCLL